MILINLSSFILQSPTMSNQNLIETERRMEEAKKVYDEALEAVNKIRQEIKTEKMAKLAKARAEVRELELEVGMHPEFERTYKCRNHPWVISTSAYYECPNCECFCE